MNDPPPSEMPQPLQIAGIDITVEEQSPLVLELLGVIQQLQKEYQELRDEIQRIKKSTLRPTIKPSVLLKPPPPEGDPSKPGKKRKRPGSSKRKKTKLYALMWMW